jgi:hypothetical protein
MEGVLEGHEEKQKGGLLGTAPMTLSVRRYFGLPQCGQTACSASGLLSFAGGALLSFVGGLHGKFFIQSAPQH